MGEEEKEEREKEGEREYDMTVEVARVEERGKGIKD